MEPETIEEACAELRKDTEIIKGNVARLLKHDFFDDDECMLDGDNVPSGKLANTRANLILVFRHLEDARMRVGKAMQAIQGGISILDK